MVPSDERADGSRGPTEVDLQLEAASSGDPPLRDSIDCYSHLRDVAMRSQARHASGILLPVGLFEIDAWVIDTGFLRPSAQFCCGSSISKQPLRLCLCL